MKNTLVNTLIIYFYNKHKKLSPSSIIFSGRSSGSILKKSSSSWSWGRPLQVGIKNYVTSQVSVFDLLFGLCCVNDQSVITCLKYIFFIYRLLFWFTHQFLGQLQGKAWLSITTGRYHHRQKYLMMFERHWQEEFTNDCW